MTSSVLGVSDMLEIWIAQGFSSHKGQKVNMIYNHNDLDLTLTISLHGNLSKLSDTRGLFTDVK